MGWRHLNEWMRRPLEFFALFSGAKDFQSNAVLGSASLNARGLHILRKQGAHAVARVYRRYLRSRIQPAVFLQLERHGFVQVDNFLPDQEFREVTDELARGAWLWLEMMQAPAVTHRVNLDAATCQVDFPALARLLRNRTLLDCVRYAAGYPGQPLIAVQRITSDVSDAQGVHDPQTDWHMDTFHSVGKAWLFLHAVGLQDGPLAYVPGSHKPNPASLAWERQQSISASRHSNQLHARGSLRVDPAELATFGFSQAHVFEVNPNTLVVADTGGVHRRMPSPVPTVRLEIYLSLRRNPFFAWCFPNLLGLPVVRRCWAGWAYWAYEALVRAGRPDWIPRGRQQLNAEEKTKLGVS